MPKKFNKYHNKAPLCDFMRLYATLCDNSPAEKSIIKKLFGRMKLISYFCIQSNNLDGKKHTIFGRIYAI